MLLENNKLGAYFIKHSNLTLSDRNLLNTVSEQPLCAFSQHLNKFYHIYNLWRKFPLLSKQSTNVQQLCLSAVFNSSVDFQVINKYTPSWVK